ncbi:MAG: hypothetical protein COS99_05605 [Candidatus Omnitrophica bacterium CG07_land_8_20_14_0_80_42_15]|uniref:Uncharacterized protein n=1 Tax=Candidatus Aquitaenariimonas noxiae TaxID=1974741 RepID=A0A2J0KYD3_9BACT|nr:MAG: hypothetical protein COS99_05605 [Candidatus Omnitrophica bacterium CG07_land_8_20_14_0_80_42_15]
MITGKICSVCGKEFIPNKYRPNQTVCSSLECQYKRQLDNMKEWRGRNTDYFKCRESKDASWKATCRERAKRWREMHKEYLSLYRQEHKDLHRVYMREYMRKYRKKSRGKKIDEAETQQEQ